MSFSRLFHSHLANSICRQDGLLKASRVLVVTTDQISPGISGELAELAIQIFAHRASEQLLSAGPTSIDAVDAQSLEKGQCCIFDGSGAYASDKIGKLSKLAASDASIAIGFGLREKQERETLALLKGTPWRLIEYDPQRYQALVEDALRHACTAANYYFGPATLIRYRDGGIAMVEHEAKKRPNDPDADSKSFCEGVCRSWIYDGNQVDPDRVFNWLNQLKCRGFEDQGRQILQYLMRYGYQRRKSVEGKLRGIYGELDRTGGRTLIPVAAQSSGKSEAFLAYYLRNQGGILDHAIKLTPLTDALKKIHKKNGYENAHIVCFDDVIGSGGSVEKSLVTENPQSSILIEGLEKRGLKFTQIAAYASPEGLKYIREKLPYDGFEVKSAREIGLDERVFGPNSSILKPSAQTEQFRSFCRDVGKLIYDPKNPLGWGNDSGWCLAFDYTVPNMTLPIIFQEGNANFTWQPLLPRRRTTPPGSF